MDADALTVLYGTDEPPSVPRRFRAGPLDVEFEAGTLRHPRFGGVEIRRGVAFLVRDTGWGTYRPAITDLDVREEPGLFRVRYRALRSGPEGRFGYRARIEGRASGALLFACAGAPEGDFPTNRLGSVVLHPIAGVAGRPMRVEHTDGGRATVTLPLAVALDRPVLDIRALAHEVAPGTWVHVRMEGDAYEMEDRRDWTDTSFKTYIRPLSEPRPYVVPAEVLQTESVALRVEGPLLAPAVGRPAAPVPSLGGARGPMPGIGLAVAAATSPTRSRWPRSCGRSGRSTSWCASTPPPGSTRRRSPAGPRWRRVASTSTARAGPHERRCRQG